MTTTATAPTTLHCPWHHGPEADCPTVPIDPDLGDLLPDLILRGINVTITPAVPHLDPCEACRDQWPHDRRADSVAVVAHRVHSEALPGGYVYEEAVCASCLWGVAVPLQRQGSPTWVEVPATVGGAR